MEKKRFFSNHAKSSAMLVSLAVHGVLIAIAVTFVAVSVMPREEPAFEPRKVNRPKMPPKKLKVPVDTKKKKPKPRLRKRIVTERKFVDIKMPEVSGVAGGLGNMGGDGMGSLGFDLDMDLFGSDRSTGNELAGTFYDLTKSDKNKDTGIDQQKYDEVVRLFLTSWRPSVLARYFKAPKAKYATTFTLPTIAASAAPEAFGVEGPAHPVWLIHYKGNFSAPETGRYRFCGQGDDLLYVRVKKRLVLDASWPGWHGRLSNWESDDDKSRKFPLGNNQMAIGDWIKMEKGRPLEIEILMGEGAGGQFCSQLLIEKQGQEYKQAAYTYGEDSGMRPLLPVFKTKEIPEELVEKMKVNRGQATLEGPTFGTVK